MLAPYQNSKVLVKLFQKILATARSTHNVRTAPKLKSFGQTFSKVCGFQRQSLGRRSQPTKSPKTAFSFCNFFFCAYGVKRKS
jgi:hypothetical protein